MLFYPNFPYLLLSGEGVDDHGGPYRAALHTALGEEPAEFLGLLSLCMNAKSESGTFLLTSSCL